MNRRAIILFSIISILSILSITSFSQTVAISDYFPDIKILESNDPAPGYFFLATKGVAAEGAQRYIAIVDNYGTPVFFRLMPGVAVSMRLLKDGTIGYIHGAPRKLYLMDEMLNVTDTINTEGYTLDGHDWDIDDDGNYNRLVFGKYTRTVDMSQLITGGNPATELGEFVIQEFDTNNNLISTWYSENLFDILDSNDESDFVDFLEESIDYIHLNSVAISSDTSFITSSRHMDEITNIDRRTGEVIWRLGGKKSDFSFINDTFKFTHQHCPRILENGNLLLFDNGNGREPVFSSAVEYELDLVNMTATLVNRFRRPTDVFAASDGATQRLANGNTVVTWGKIWPSLTEFHPDGSVAIEFDMLEHSLSPRIEKYQWKTKVIETSVDSIDFGMYDGINPIHYIINVINNTDTVMNITSYSTRTENFVLNTNLPLELQPGIQTDLSIQFNPQNTTTGFLKDVITINSDNSTQRIARQVYLEGHQSDNITPTVAILPDSSNVPVDAIINLEFTEAIRLSNGVELNYSNIAEQIIFRKNDLNGEDIPFTASINTAKDNIIVKPISLLDSSAIYYVSIYDQIEDYSGNSLTITPITFETYSDLTAIEEIASEQEINIYPNPSKAKFSIETTYLENLVARVYSPAGLKVFEKSISNPSKFIIDLTGKSPGIYILIINSESNKIRKSEKLILK